MLDTSCTSPGSPSFIPQLLHWLKPPRQHDVVPDDPQVSDLTHVALAFMRPGVFNQPNPSSWPMFTTVDKARSQFAPGTAIMVAIGGWGDTEGFEVAAKTEGSRRLFARNMMRMVEDTGADGPFAHKPNCIVRLMPTQALTLIGNIQGQQKPSSAQTDCVNFC